jgi:hypothetical protein
MAQKTPLPALTVMYADRWNNTWFVDLENFRTQLMEDYHLRFLLTGFLRLKRQWLYLLSIHKSGGFYFFQVVTLNAVASPQLKAVLQPTENNKKKLFYMNTLVKKNKLLQSDAFDSLKKPLVPHWKRRMSYKKSRTWLTLRNKSFIVKRARLSTFSNIKKQKLKDILKTKTWLNLNKNKIALSYYNVNLVKFYYKNNTSFNLLFTMKKKNTALKKANLQFKGNSLMRLKQLLENRIILNTKEQTTLKLLNKLLYKPKIQETSKPVVVPTWNKQKNNNFNRKSFRRYFHNNSNYADDNDAKELLSDAEKNVNKHKMPKSTNSIKRPDNSNKRFFSTQVIVTANKTFATAKDTFGKKKKIVFKNLNFLNNYNNQNMLQNFLEKKQLNHLYYYQAPKRFYKRKLSIYRTLRQFTSYLYQRMFRYKKYPTIKEGYKVLCKKYGHTLRFKTMLRRFSNSFLFIGRGLSRVTAMRINAFYYPMKWSGEDYKPLKKSVFFEKYGAQKSFVPSVSVMHLALSRGSANLIIDLLVRELRRAFIHVPFLSCVEKICRYFMTPYEGNIAFKNSLCKGMDILFKGKLNGGDRSKNWRFKFGPVHTSTFFTNTREEHAKCMTRYGVFHIRVRVKLGAIVEDNIIYNNY